MVGEVYTNSFGPPGFTAAIMNIGTQTFERIRSVQGVN